MARSSGSALLPGQAMSPLLVPADAEGKFSPPPGLATPSARSKILMKGDTTVGEVDERQGSFSSSQKMRRTSEDFIEQGQRSRFQVCTRVHKPANRGQCPVGTRSIGPRSLRRTRARSTSRRTPTLPSPARSGCPSAPRAAKCASSAVRKRSSRVVVLSAGLL